MENKTGNKIRDLTSLRHQIMKLNARKEDQESALLRGLKEVLYLMHPSVMISRAFQQMKTDGPMMSDTVSSLVSFGGNFLLDKLTFRKGAGIKSYLVNAGLKKLLSLILPDKKEAGELKSSAS